MKKMPVLLQMLLMYVLVVVLVFLALLPVYRTTYGIAKNNYIKDRQAAFNVSLANLNKIADSISLFRKTIEQNPYYITLKLTDDTRPTKYYFTLMKSKNAAYHGLRLIENVKESFMLFTNSGTIITRSSAFDTPETAFSGYMSFDGYTAADIKEAIMEASIHDKYLPQTRVTFFGGDPSRCVMFVFKANDDSVIYCVLLSEENLGELFGLSDMPANTFLYLTDKNNSIAMDIKYKGDPLVLPDSINAIQYQQQKYTVLSGNLDFINMSVNMGIPEQYFADMMIPMKKLIWEYSAAALIFGVLLGICFSLLNYLPLKRLKDMPLVKNNFVGRKGFNLYGCIQEAIVRGDMENRNLQYKVWSMKNTLQADLYTRLQHGTLIPAQDDQLVREMLPVLTGEYSVALIRPVENVRKQSSELFQEWLFKELVRKFSDTNTLSHFDARVVSVLIPGSGQAISQFCTTVLSLNEESHKIFNNTIRVGLSGVNRGTDNVCDAMNQAYYAMSADSIKPILSYGELSDKNEFLTQGELQNLYQMELLGDSEKIGKTVDKIDSKVRKFTSKAAMCQAYAILQAVLNDVVLDLGLDKIDDNSLKETDINGKLDWIREKSLQIADQIRSRKKDEKMQLRNDVLMYIKSNFRNSDLYADTIARAFNCTEKSIYSCVREATGTSLSAYIEKLRMNYALETIQKTEKPIAWIAQECGYHSNNNFYKAFKKYFGLPPGCYRNRKSSGSVENIS